MRNLDLTIVLVKGDITLHVPFDEKENVSNLLISAMQSMQDETSRAGVVNISNIAAFHASAVIGFYFTENSDVMAKKQLEFQERSILAQEKSAQAHQDMARQRNDGDDWKN